MENQDAIVVVHVRYLLGYIIKLQRVMHLFMWFPTL